MKRIIAAGHICLDITPVFPAQRNHRELSDVLVPGKLIQMEGADVHTGGSVANTGLALKILGNDVTLMGKVGADAFGFMVQSILEKYGVGGLYTDPSGTPSYSVVLAVPGVDRVFLHDPGANDTFINSDIPDSVLKDAALLHFGYPPLMRQMYTDGGRELVSIFRRAKEHGLATSLDFATIDPSSAAGKADWKKILQNVLPYVDFFVPSFEELCFMLDRPHYEELAAQSGDMTTGLNVEAECLPLANTLLDMGCRFVLIKCGTSGMLYRSAGREAIQKIGQRICIDAGAWADRTGVQRCFKAEIVRSGTGAGDTSIAAFLTSVLSGRTPEECVALAAAEGACCVTAYDALSGLKSIRDLEELIRNGWETM